ncbi:MAG: hypothetical protein MJZ34_01570 [Paludibacteraceae bacterium]|nr:hypothetical protein [Paludibacteraceae bacterium]
MVMKFLNWAIDYWVMLNYVFYKYYSKFKRETDPEGCGMVYAPGWVGFNYLTVGIVLDLMGYPIASTFLKHRILCFILPYVIVFLPNYFFLYYKGKWKDVFLQIDKERDTEKVKRRYRNTVIYIWVTVALLLIPVIVKGLYYQFG